MGTRNSYAKSVAKLKKAVEKFLGILALPWIPACLKATIGESISDVIVKVTAGVVAQKVGFVVVAQKVGFLVRRSGATSAQQCVSSAGEPQPWKNIPTVQYVLGIAGIYVYCVVEKKSAWWPWHCDPVERRPCDSFVPQVGKETCICKVPVRFVLHIPVKTL